MEGNKYSCRVCPAENFEPRLIDVDKDGRIIHRIAVCPECGSTEIAFVVTCRGCQKVGSIYANRMGFQQGFQDHRYFDDEKDEEIEFWLCNDCDCPRCPEAIQDFDVDETGEEYPVYECSLERCRYL